MGHVDRESFRDYLGMLDCHDIESTMAVCEPFFVCGERDQFPILGIDAVSSRYRTDHLEALREIVGPETEQVQYMSAPEEARREYDLSRLLSWDRRESGIRLVGIGRTFAAGLQQKLSPSARQPPSFTFRSEMLTSFWYPFRGCMSSALNQGFGISDSKMVDAAEDGLYFMLYALIAYMIEGGRDDEVESLKKLLAMYRTPCYGWLADDPTTVVALCI